MELKTDRLNLTEIGEKEVFLSLRNKETGHMQHFRLLYTKKTGWIIVEGKEA